MAGLQSMGSGNTAGPAGVFPSRAVAEAPPASAAISPANCAPVGWPGPGDGAARIAGFETKQAWLLVIKKVAPAGTTGELAPEGEQDGGPFMTGTRPKLFAPMFVNPVSCRRVVSYEKKENVLSFWNAPPSVAPPWARV